MWPSLRINSGTTMLTTFSFNQYLKRCVLVITAQLFCYGMGANASETTPISGSDATVERNRDIVLLMETLTRGRELIFEGNRNEAHRKLKESVDLVKKLQAEAPQVRMVKELAYGHFKLIQPVTQPDFYIAIFEDFDLHGDGDYPKFKVGALSPYSGKETFELVYLRVSLELHETEESLIGALAALEKGDIDTVDQHLTSIARNAVSEEILVSDPLTMIYGYLVLTHRYLEMEEYPSARKTVKRAARTALQLHEKPLADDRERAVVLKQLQVDINAMEAQLRTEEPDMKLRL
jgi:hypothetical protein